MNTRMMLLAGVWVACGSVVAYAAGGSPPGSAATGRPVSSVAATAIPPLAIPPRDHPYAGLFHTGKTLLDGHEDREDGGGDQEHGEHHGEHEHGEHHGDQGDH